MNTETSSKELITKVPANGYALREQNRYILDDPAIDGVEITFERADEPLRVARYLDDLQFGYVSIHAMKISVGSPDPPRRDYLDALRRPVPARSAITWSLSATAPSWAIFPHYL